MDSKAPGALSSRDSSSQSPPVQGKGCESTPFDQARETLTLVKELYALQSVNFQYLKLRLAFLEEDRKTARQLCTSILQAASPPSINYDLPEDFQMLLFQLEKHVMEGLKYLEKLPGSEFVYYEEYVASCDAIQSLTALMQVYATYFPKHLLIMSEKGPVHRLCLTVEGAGVKEVNGMYLFTENINGAGLYSRRGEYQGKSVTYTIYRSGSKPGDQRSTWYLKCAAIQNSDQCTRYTGNNTIGNASSFKYTLMYEGSSGNDVLPPTNTWAKLSSSEGSQEPVPTVTIHTVEEIAASGIIRSENVVHIDEEDDYEVEYVK